MIIFNPSIMRASIDFNDNTAVRTEKIHNVIAYNFLSVKIKSLEFPLMELLPHQNFTQVPRFSQFFCSCLQACIV